LIQLIELLNNWLDDNLELKRTFAIWIRAVLLRNSKNKLVLPKIQDLKELKMTLAERFDQWAHQHQQRGVEMGIEKGIQKGMEKGIEKGEALILQRQLARRFGVLPSEILETIAAASAGQIEIWCDRVLDAQSLGEVFTDD
jgi:flagellar biosynthesis/type III secretory pathway protein FliH